MALKSNLKDPYPIFLEPLTFTPEENFTAAFGDNYSSI
jgi:hypothetical protein